MAQQLDDLAETGRQIAIVVDDVEVGDPQLRDELAVGLTRIAMLDGVLDVAIPGPPTPTRCGPPTGAPRSSSSRSPATSTTTMNSRDDGRRRRAHHAQPPGSRHRRPLLPTDALGAAPAAAGRRGHHAERNWWAPAPLGRFHDRYGLHEAVHPPSHPSSGWQEPGPDAVRVEPCIQDGGPVRTYGYTVSSPKGARMHASPPPNRDT